MDKHFVKSVIEGLKSTSSSRVQETLLIIRNKVIVDDNGIKLFRECGGLDYVVPHLRKPNERILDLTLSILGNCCLEDGCCSAVGKLSIFPSLITVLNTVSRDSIVGRACRLIGNLAQKTSNAEDLHNHGAVSALVTLIEGRDKNTSYPTLTMAVRAVRQLWMVTGKREEMLSVNTVRCIAILLTTECETAGILKTTNPKAETAELRKSQEELITGILKCFGCFTTHCAAQCAEQIQGDGRGYQCLVALTKVFESLALRCLMNLCYLSHCRPLLGTAGLVECLVSILQKISEVSWWPEGAARTLSQLSGESVNRSRIRRCGGLALLVAAAREDVHALRALLQYVFDEDSFQIMVNEGLVGLLTDEITKHLDTMKIEHDYKEVPIKESDQEENKTESSEDKNNSNAKKSEEKEPLYSRRKRLSTVSDDGLHVLIERDNMYIGFSETVDSDASDSEDEETQRRRKRKRPCPWDAFVSRKSPTSFMRRTRIWKAGVYWEMKSDDPTTSQAQSRAAMADDPTPLSPCSEGNYSGFSPDFRPTSKRGRWDWSPESGFSTMEGSVASPNGSEYPWSPSSSGGPTSPFSVNEDSSDSEISGRYSPVCSEHEPEADAPTAASGELDAAQLALDELAVDDAEANDDNGDEPSRDSEKETYNIDMNSSRISCVLVLLYSLSNGTYENSLGIKEDPNIQNQMLELLTGKEFLNALIDYVERCRKPTGRAARVLTLICGNALSLINILKNRLPLRLHEMNLTSKHPVSKCQQCRLLKKLSLKLMSRLTLLAESSYGIGEISYQLLRGPDSMKEILSLTLPYVVKAKGTLRKFYIECSALNVLFATIPDSTEKFCHLVTSLGKLANSVRIKDPKSLESKFSDHVSISYDPTLDNLSKDEIVTFELDDLSTVKANKTFLCQNSDVFSAMLSGCFKESAEQCVQLKNVTKPALEYLLTLLHCGLNNSKCNIEVFPMVDKLETNLEVLLLADRFLFEKLKVLLNSAILQFKMTPETVDKIYVWSLSEGMGFLCVESVAYLLTGQMCETKRARSFRNILNLEYKEQWLDDIKSIIIRQLEEWT